LYEDAGGSFGTWFCAGNERDDSTARLSSTIATVFPAAAAAPLGQNQ